MRMSRFGSRRVWALASVLLSMVALLASIGPVARRVARSKAESLGLHLEIRETRLGLGKVHFRGVTVSSAELPSISASFAEVAVAPGLRSRRIEVHGGAVLVDGSVSDLERQMKAWRAAHARGGEHERGSSSPLSVDGIDVRWKRATDVLAHVWGARYARAADGVETLAADLVHANVETASMMASGVLARLERDGSHRVLQSVSLGHLDATVDLDRRDGRVSPQTRVVAPNAARPVVDPVRSPTGEGSSSLRAEMARLGTAAGSWLRSSSMVTISPVHLEVHHAGQVLNIGPASVKLGRDATAVRAQITSGSTENSAPMRLEVSVPLAAGPVDIGLSGGPVSLSALGVEEHDMGLEDVDRAEVEVDGHASLSEDGRSLRISGRSRLTDVSLQHRKLASDPVRGLRLGLAGRGELDLDGSHVHVEDLEVTVGKVKLHARGEIERSAGEAKGRVHVDVPLAACADMLASIPPALVPLLSGLEAKGTFAFSGDLEFDTQRPGDTRIDWDAANECRVASVPAALSPERFAHPWSRTVLGPGGVPITIESGPGTPAWVPLFDVSPYMATAVVVCEDSSFWVHTGFNEKSIRDSIRDNLRAGKFLRGASTVSMQLAKNLYLAREKTLSRKLQESVLTLLLEQSLTKEQILELYLNVIEFAPGLYGIGPATEHYFHTLPRDLTLGQAFYLVSILPNPKIHHFAADGTLSTGWSEYLHHLMEIAHKIHKIDDRELAAGLAETIRFGEQVGGDAEPGDPSGSAPEEVQDLVPRDEGDEGP